MNFHFRNKLKNIKCLVIQWILRLPIHSYSDDVNTWRTEYSKRQIQDNYGTGCSVPQLAFNTYSES